MLETNKIILKIKALMKENDSKENGIETLGIKNKIEELLQKAYMTYNKEVEKYISSVIELPEDDSICAIVSRESYRTPLKRKKEINGFIIDNKISTKDIAIYVNKLRKVCILGYRGTNIKRIKDLSSDIQILLDIQGIDPRIKSALRTYDICRREYEQFGFRVCGHSLGGTISYVVSKHRKTDKCVVFNPGVSINTFFFQMIEDTIKGSSWTTKTKTYKILGDIISSVAFVGDTKVFSIKSSDPLKKHTIDNFLPPKKIEDILKNVQLQKLTEA